MPRYYFDCLTNGVLYPDEFGVEMPHDEISEQAHMVMMNIMSEVRDGKASMSVSVTVREDQRGSIYVAYGTINGYTVTPEKRGSMGFSESIQKDSNSLDDFVVFRLY